MPFLRVETGEIDHEWARSRSINARNFETDEGEIATHHRNATQKSRPSSTNHHVQLYVFHQQHCIHHTSVTYAVTYEEKIVRPRAIISVNSIHEVLVSAGEHYTRFMIRGEGCVHIAASSTDACDMAWDHGRALDARNVRNRPQRSAAQ